MQSQQSWVDLRSFAAVDDADDPAPLIRALDVGKASPSMRKVGVAMTEGLRLAQARAVLDLGCGLGDDTLAMAAEIPDGGQVTGVDVSRTMVAEATARALGMSAPVPPAVVNEIYRVLQPGGRAAAFEFDLGTSVLDHPDRSTTRTILDYVTDAALDGWIGRQLPRLYREAGFSDVSAVPYPVSSDYDLFMFTMRRPLAQLVHDRVLTARDVVHWLREFEELHRAGHYLGGSVGYLVTETKD